MEYLVEDEKFILRYQELVETFNKFKNMNDKDFIDNLPSIIHFACIVCFLKEVPTHLCLSDKGIIHELAHLLDIPKDNTTPLIKIRELFNERLALL